MNEQMKAPVEYEERLCLFLDILGFKSLIAESAQKKESTKENSISCDVGRIYSTLRAIDRVMKPTSYITLGELDNSSKQVTQFSDSIVVSYKLEDRSAVFDMLYDIYFLQIELVQRRILVRGAITAGLLFHDEQMVFGPALVEAVELEKLALYPRVILHHDIIDYGKRRHANHHSSKDEEKYIRSMLKQDLDGMYYINYFSPSPDDFDEGWGGFYDYQISLRETVKKLSQFKNMGIKLKHSWMRQKYNEVASTLEQSKHSKFDGHMVPEDLSVHILNLLPFRS